MKKLIISFILALSLFLNSCTSIRINGIEINETRMENIDTEDILGWMILISVCGIMYVGVPIYIANNIKQY